MEILLTFWCTLFTIPLSYSSSSPSPPPSAPIVSIPLYHEGLLKDRVMSSEEVNFPQTEAKADIYSYADAFAIFLWIGTPVQIVLVRMDTGSPITWTQCDPCSASYPMQRPAFNTRASDSFRELGCYSDACLIPMMMEIFGNCTGRNCRYNVEYAKGSHSFGMMVTESLKFERFNVEVKSFIMGCGDSYRGPFKSQFSGVFGLGRGTLSVQSQLQAKAFSFCSLSPGSIKPSFLEFYDTPPRTDQHGNNSIMVPLTENSRYPYYYFLQFVGIGINGFMLDIQSRVWGYGLNYDGGVIIDTGTTLTRLPSDAYTVFKSEINRTDHNLTKKRSSEGLEFCYKDDPSNVYPTIEFYFENGYVAGENFVTFKLNSNQLLFRAEDDTVCLSFVEGKDSALTVIGSNQLQGTQLTYDLVNEILVFTYNKC